MISLIFIILASVCNAFMDTSVHHYSTSIFSKLNPLWWNGEISWKNKYIDGDSTKGRVKWFFGINKPIQITDAFHFFKMLMIIFICSSIATFDRQWVFNEYTFWSCLLAITIYGTLWNLTFSLFYNKILKR